MSELIDSIYDVPKLSSESKEILSMLQNMKGAIEDIKTLTGEIRKDKSFEDLAKSSKTLNDQIVKGQKSTSEYAKLLAKAADDQNKLTASTKELGGQQKKLTTTEAKLATTNNETNKTLLTRQEQLKKVTAAAKAQAVLDDKEAGTLEKLAASNKLLSIEKGKLNLETEKGQTRLKEINTEQDNNNKLLVDASNTSEKQKANIGNYQSALAGLTPQVGGLAGKLLAVAKAAKASGDGLNEGGKSASDGVTKLGTAPKLFTKIGVGLKGMGQMIGTVGKAFLANPIGLVIAAIAITVKGLTSAFARSEERTNKLKLATANFQPVLKLIGDGFEHLADMVINTVEFFGKAFSAVTKFLNIDPESSSSKFVEAEKMKQNAVQETRKLNEDASKQDAIINEQRAIIANKELYTYKERVNALKLAGEAEEKLATDRLKIAELNQKALEAEAALDDNNAEMNDKLSAAIVATNQARKDAAAVSRKIGLDAQKLASEEIATQKAKAAAEKEAAQKIIETRRTLVDSQLEIMQEGEEKQIALSEEAFKREIEDLKASGELTAELQKNLEIYHLTELQEIRKDFATERLEAEKEEAEKIQAQKKESLEKALNDFEDNIKKEAELLNASYAEKETELKRQYANGLISKEDYENDLIDIQNESVKTANDALISSLQNELDVAQLSEEKRAEFSNQLRDLKIANENAILDATIKSNEDAANSDKNRFDNLLGTINDIYSAGMELFSAIGDYQAQQSEKRIEEIEAQQEISDAAFDEQQENLDNSIMSDESRANAQTKLDEEKAAKDEELAARIHAEEVKQAKWEKAQNLVSAFQSTAMAVIKAWELGPILGPVFAGIAAATGAVQIATIASQQIPAYETGTMDTGNGLGLWGEKRPEVAVTKSGQMMYAEKPTVSKFDAGTRIYKSVSDFENSMQNSTMNKNFSFDYDKMAEKMPATSITLDSRGLWGEIDKQGNRRNSINRRYKLN